MFSDLIIWGRLSLFQFNLEIYTKYFTLPLNEEYGWPISTLSEIAGITRDAYYKWIHRKANIHDDEQAELLKAILELEKSISGPWVI